MNVFIANQKNQDRGMMTIRGILLALIIVELVAISVLTWLKYEEIKLWICEILGTW